MNPMGDTGDTPTRCKATNRQGNPCTKAAMPGTTVCRWHGGLAPQVQAKAKLRLAEAAAVQAVQTYGLPQDVDPLEALLAELHRSAGHVAWLGAVVASLDEVMEQTMFGLAPSGWVKLYQSERAHLAKVARDCLSAGVEERRVRIAEDQATLVANAFRHFAVLLGHDVNAPEVRAAFRSSLELVRGQAS